MTENKKSTTLKGGETKQVDTTTDQNTMTKQCPVCKAYFQYTVPAEYANKFVEYVDKVQCPCQERGKEHDTSKT